MRFFTKPSGWAILGLLSVLTVAAPSRGDFVTGSETVDGTDALFNYSSNVIGGGSTDAVVIELPTGTDRVLTFSSVTGTVVLNLGTGSNYNYPDGVGAAVASSSNTGAAGLSGIFAPNAGFLTGAFLIGNGTESEQGSTPSALNFNTLGTNFASLSPLDDQTFFIGDGLTGDGSGSVQQFIVPNNATYLVLGIVDAFGYNGAPGAYGDNGGSFLANYTITGDLTTAVPEPSTLTLLGIGTCVLMGYGWKRRIANQRLP